MWFNHSASKPVSPRKSQAFNAVRRIRKRLRAPVMPRRSAAATWAQVFLPGSLHRIVVRTAAVWAHTPVVGWVRAEIRGAFRADSAWWEGWCCGKRWHARSP